MKRLTIKPRLNWQQKCDEVGFHFYYMNGLYWNEGACYQFSAEEIDELEAATAELQRLCLETVERVIVENRFNQLCIPPEFAALCRRSWQRQDPSIYGRFDFIYDGIHPPKLLEYNADTPTALLEASVVQWSWLEDVLPEQDQFNSIHEKLLLIFDYLNINHQTLHFACEQNSLEDLGTVEYLRDVAIQAGLKTKPLFIDDVGWSQDENFFCDLDNEKIEYLFKLYPWEWMMRDDFGQCLLSEPMQLIEPAWKMILSNKAILPLLWEFFPNHPNLLAADFNPFTLPHPYVSKPIFSREGANVTIYYGDRTYQTSGNYDDEPLIYQAYFPLPEFEGYYPIIGSWIIGNEPAGIGIREDRTIVTQNSSLFVPHYFTTD